MNIETFRRLALGFPGVEESPHFDKASFRAKKKIFATFDEKKNKAVLKMSESEQDIFSLIDKKAIYPVPNKWGKQGWTVIEVAAVPTEVIVDALSAAYNHVAAKKK